MRTLNKEISWSFYTDLSFQGSPLGISEMIRKIQRTSQAYKIINFFNSDLIRCFETKTITHNEKRIRVHDKLWLLFLVP